MSGYALQERFQPIPRSGRLSKDLEEAEKEKTRFIAQAVEFFEKLLAANSKKKKPNATIEAEIMKKYQELLEEMKKLNRGLFEAYSGSAVPFAQKEEFPTTDDWWARELENFRESIKGWRITLLAFFNSMANYIFAGDLLEDLDNRSWLNWAIRNFGNDAGSYGLGYPDDPIADPDQVERGLKAAADEMDHIANKLRRIHNWLGSLGWRGGYDDVIDKLREYREKIEELRDELADAVGSAAIGVHLAPKQLQGAVKKIVERDEDIDDEMVKYVREKT